jgi:cytochrome c biogenesis protein CcmG, thiol:disulfide interchange protein DsbE
MHTMKYMSVLLVVGATFMGSLKKTDAVLAATLSSDNKSDRLYRDLGVLKVPRIAPPVDFKLKDIKGRSVRLSDFRGKVVFLNFWATWCPPVSMKCRPCRNYTES